jgi:hypothetical protein
MVVENQPLMRRPGAMLDVVAGKQTILNDGDPFTAWGRLVGTPEGLWFDPPLARFMPAYRDGPPAPAPSHFAIPIRGADMLAVANRYDRDGCAEGWATITGTWHATHLLARSQSIQPRPRADPHPRTTPPCPPPEGGWPHTAAGGLDFTLEDLTEPAALVSAVLFRPAEDQLVLVAACADLEAVEAVLRPQLGQSLCLTRSRFSRAQIDQARAVIRQHRESWDLYLHSDTYDADGQESISASPIRVTPEIAEWADTLPAGLLTLNPWLSPQR